MIIIQNRILIIIVVILSIIYFSIPNSSSNTAIFNDKEINSLKDICDPGAAKFFKIYQTPAAGTVIQNTKIPQFVTLHVADP